jgi:hypothetical protein
MDRSNNEYATELEEQENILEKFMEETIDKSEACDRLGVSEEELRAIVESRVMSEERKL